MLLLKLTNASGALGERPVDHFALCDHVPPSSTFHDTPVGGVTRAQAVSTRSSSICTLGTPVPCRSTNAATDGASLAVRSVPMTGAVMIGDAAVDEVGALAAPKALGLM